MQSRWLYALIMAPMVLSAQTPKKTPPAAPAPTPAPAASDNPVSGAVGFVGDSIHGGPLVGAVVEIVGTGRKGTTDTSGRFRIDSIPPGAYKLTMSHPLLDSLGVAIATNEVQFPAGRYALIGLATPSPTTIDNTFCPAEKQKTGPGIVVGQVRDADSDVPSTGAKVSMTWSQIIAGKTIGLHQILRNRESIVDAGGNYRICGVPVGTKAVVRASFQGMATADIPVDFTDGTIQLVTLHTAKPDTAPPPPVVDTAPSTTSTAAAPKTPAAPKPAVVGLRTGHANLSGRVVNAADRPLAGANVEVFGAASKTQTDSNGNFTLRNLPSGTQTLVVRKLLFAAVTQPVDLSTKGTQTAKVIMKQAPPVLATVKVQATGVEKGLNDVGYSRRQKMGLGHFMNRQQIEEKIPTYMTDIFTTTPGIRVDYSSGQPVLTGTRGTTGNGCVNYVVDGTPYSEASPGDINDFMHPNEVEAVEVYSDVDTPAEYAKPGTSCTTVIIWTKTRTGDLK